MSSSRQRVAHSWRVAVTEGEVFPIQSPLPRTNPGTVICFLLRIDKGSPDGALYSGTCIHNYGNCNGT